MASLIRGEWTHRRGGPGGERAVDADVDRPRPAVAWTWSPPHGGRVDQVRVTEAHVFVATLRPRDPLAPGWEHAIIYALDAVTGAEVAWRALPDPAPVAAMAIASDTVHILATAKGEPLHWYALSAPGLVPRFRRVASDTRPARHDDVVDVWTRADGRLWIELDLAAADDAVDVPRMQTFAVADVGESSLSVKFCYERRPGDGAALACDACVGADGALIVPVQGGATPGPSLHPAAGESVALRPDPPPAMRHETPPRLWQIKDRGEPRPWASAERAGLEGKFHALSGGGLVYGFASTADRHRPDRTRVEAIAVDALTGAMRWRGYDDRVPLAGMPGGAARTARRDNGEVLFQSLGPNGVPCTPLLCARPDGRIDALVLGTRSRYVLDATLGAWVLAHREDKAGRVEVAAFGIDGEGRLLGRRAVLRWALDAGDLGGDATVYAGGGVIVVRGAARVTALKL